MSFQDTWNTTYEGIPSDSELINLGANRIRDLKVNIRERGGTCLSWGDTLDNGQLNQAAFNVQTADPTGGATGTGWLYIKAVGAINELFWEDNAGQVEQLTSNGQINYQAFPSGTVLSFIQATPPTGWTQQPGLTDRVLRLVGDGSGGGTGGSWTITGVTVATGVTTTVSTTVSTTTTVNTTTTTSVSDTGSSISVSANPAALTVDQLPPHNHNVVVTVGGGNGGPQTGQYNATFQSPGTTFTTDGGSGLAGNAHNHSINSSLHLSLGAASSSSSPATSTSTASSPASSSATSTFSNDNNWRPAYVNACIGKKT